MTIKKNNGLKIICLNRKASFNYFLIDKFEAGLVLQGSEIKSVRSGKVSEFRNTLVDAMQKQVAKEMGYKLIDYRTCLNDDVLGNFREVHIAVIGYFLIL